MLRAVFAFAVWGASQAARVGIEDRLTEFGNHNSTGGDKCCCNKEPCKPGTRTDEDGNQLYNIVVGGNDWCCKHEEDGCGWFSYKTWLGKNGNHPTNQEHNCLIKKERCPSCGDHASPTGIFKLEEDPVTGASLPTNQLICGCECHSGFAGDNGQEYTPQNPQACNQCLPDRGPAYPDCSRRKCKGSRAEGSGPDYGIKGCSGHGTPQGYIKYNCPGCGYSECSCQCDAGWEPMMDCAIPTLQGSPCEQKAYLIYAELTDVVNDNRYDASKAERLARAYCRKKGSTDSSAVSCLSGYVSQCLKTKLKADCAVEATEECVRL